MFSEITTLQTLQGVVISIVLFFSAVTSHFQKLPQKLTIEYRAVINQASSQHLIIANSVPLTLTQDPSSLPRLSSLLVILL